MEVSGQFHPLPALLPEKSLWYLSDMRLDELQNWSECGGKKKKKNSWNTMLISQLIERSFKQTFCGSTG